MGRSGDIASELPKRKRSCLERALSNFVYKLLEYLGVLLHQLREDFSVERDIVFLERVYEFAVGKIFRSESFVCRSLPTLPKYPFFGFPVAERVFPRVAQGVFREPYFRFSAPTKTLRLF